MSVIMVSEVLPAAADAVVGEGWGGSGEGKG